MRTVRDRGLRDLLTYLEELGFEDLYLTAQEAAVAKGAGSREPAAPVGRTGSDVQTEGRAAMPAATPQAAKTGDRGAPEPSGSAEDDAGRAEALRALGGEVSSCERCRLWRGRNSVVFGSGDPNADLMFVGEGPGAEEDRQGLPFVGPAGALLTKMIEAIDLTRESVYITNVVKCRPPGNRDPLPDEAGACRGYLERQIELVRPRVIVALGRVAAQALLGNDLPLGRMRGRWSTVLGVPTMVTYHPAALLRNRAWKRPAWEDLQAVRDRLKELGAS